MPAPGGPALSNPFRKMPEGPKYSHRALGLRRGPISEAIVTEQIIREP